MATQDDLEFQKLVLANRLATPKQIDECLLEIEKNEKGGFLNPLSTIMIDKGLLPYAKLKLFINCKENL